VARRPPHQQVRVLLAEAGGGAYLVGITSHFRTLP
jgi:hypothetical protein